MPMFSVSRLGYFEASAAAAAAEQGNEHILSLLHENGYHWDSSTCEAAVSGGHLSCLQFLCNNGCPIDESCLTLAARDGRLDIFSYVLSVGVLNLGACAIAAAHGSLAILAYAHNHECPFYSEVTERAAEGGHIHCLEYALLRGCPIGAYAPGAACKGGHIDCLRLLFAHGATLTAHTARQAGAGGSIACLTFLHENGCPWTSETPQHAAFGGHVDALRYAIDNGCLYDDDIINTAAMAKTGSVPCLRYLIEEQGLYMDEEGAAFGNAFSRGDAECVAYLIDVGCPYEPFVFEELSRFDIQLVTISGLSYRFRKSVNEQLFTDEELAKSITCAVEHGWGSNSALYREVCSGGFQKSRKYLEDEGLCVFESETDGDVEEYYEDYWT